MPRGESGPRTGPVTLAPGMRLAQMLTLRDQTDDTGRLLLEDSAPKRAIKNVKRNGIPMKTERCPYTDTPSRTGGLMNVSAYEALRRDTADMLNGFSWLTTNYLASEPSRRSTIRTLFDVSYMGVTLPLILFHRRPDPIDKYGALPSYVGSLCKASRGLVSAAVDMLNKAGPPSRQVTAADVVRFADEEGHLRRPNTERACAAPTRLIERTIGVILTGQGADATRSHLGELIDFPTLSAFCALQDGFSQALSSYKFLLDKLSDAGQANDPHQLFSTRVVVEGRPRTFGDLSEELVRRANATQAGLNHLLGRADHPVPVSFEELLRML